jgi:hypothetical protein
MNWSSVDLDVEFDPGETPDIQGIERFVGMVRVVLPYGSKIVSYTIQTPRMENDQIIPAVASKVFIDFQLFQSCIFRTYVCEHCTPSSIG